MQKGQTFTKEVFWRKFDSRVSPEPNTGCWLWDGNTSVSGYGRNKVWNGNASIYRLAHVLAWERVNGPIPDGLCIDHLCRVRCCVNPDHMELVTLGENVLRGVGVAALNARKTHCKMGMNFPLQTPRYVMVAVVDV